MLTKDLRIFREIWIIDLLYDLNNLKYYKFKNFFLLFKVKKNV